MLTADAAFLRRFLAESTSMPRDTRAWSLGLLFGGLKNRERSAWRDELLRHAAALLEPASPWVHAHQLEAIARSLSRALPADPDPGTVRGRVAAAALLYPGRRPFSTRSIYRALLADKPPVELSVPPVRRSKNEDDTHGRQAAEPGSAGEVSRGGNEAPRWARRRAASGDRQ